MQKYLQYCIVDVKNVSPVFSFQLNPQTKNSPKLQTPNYTEMAPFIIFIFILSVIFMLWSVVRKENAKRKKNYPPGITANPKILKYIYTLRTKVLECNQVA